MLCEYRTVYKIGELFFQMKTISERHELFITTLFVFSREQDEKLRMIIYDQIINSGCVETLARVRRKWIVIFDLYIFVVYSLHRLIILVEFNKCRK